MCASLTPFSLNLDPSIASLTVATACTCAVSPRKREPTWIGEPAEPAPTVKGLISREEPLPDVSSARRDAAARLAARLAIFAAFFSAAVGGALMTAAGVVLGAQNGKGRSVIGVGVFFTDGKKGGAEGLNWRRGAGVEGKN